MASAAESRPERITITLIRHGESTVTVERILGGQRSCRGLSELGRRQSERLRDRFAEGAGPAADVLISSDFARAIETAEIIRPGMVAGVAGDEIERWPDLGEHDPGPDLDGISFEAYVERFGRPDWTDRDADMFPGGETIRRFHERVDRALDELFHRFAGRHVAVACHGGVVDAVFRSLLGLEMVGGFELTTLNTAITTLSGPADRADGGRWRLVTYNDTAHLHGLPDATPRRS